MREILRQMMEYEAEENDEELRGDAEYAAALEELKHRLAREGDDDEDDMEDRYKALHFQHTHPPWFSF